MWKEEFCDLFALFTNAPSTNNYSHVVELHLEFQKLLWRLHGASLEGRLIKSFNIRYNIIIIMHSTAIM